tara:strand:+ start:201 stop:833 length:633 start_codon:yes stop_codon:yes gene_type:complete
MDYLPFHIANAIVVWDVETTELIDKRRVPIEHMEISVACAMIFDASDVKLENVQKRTFWHASVLSSFKMDDLCKLLSSCRAHVAFNGRRFDMVVMKKHFESQREEELAFERLHDPLQDISVISYYSLNDLLAENQLGRKTASGKDAPVMWKAGRYEDLAKYCMSDVELLAHLITKASSVALPMLCARVPLSISRILFPDEFTKVSFTQSL